MIVILLYLWVSINQVRDLQSKISIQVNNNIYLKDPETSDLGLKIISGSINLIDDIGFEAFTFRKLATAISSTEASVYRYFESKHKLLVYLSSWYWAWMEYRLVFALANIPSAEERLKRSITLLTEKVKQDGSVAHVDEVKLNQIVICDSSKAFLTKEVDEENKLGVFLEYKAVVERISQIILEINGSYKYPHMLVSTIIEGAHNQRYFADHLPQLTDVVKGRMQLPSFIKRWSLM